MTPTVHQTLVSPLHFTLKENDEPLYLQLMAHIVALIEQGHLVAQQRMPSSRVLSESLSVSRSTVVNAYDRLIAEDILYAEPKKGIFVAQKPLLQSFRLSEKEKNQIASVPQSHHGKEKNDVIRFDSGADPAAFPKQAWLKSLRISWRTPDLLVLSDNYITGFPLLKMALADYLFQLRGLRCHPDQIVITAGNLDSLTLINHLLNRISPDSEWYIENPSYQQMQVFIQSRQKQLNYLPVDEAGCTLPSQHSKSPPVILMTPNRQYPLGMTMESTRRQEWLNLLDAKKCWVIEDDYDNEFNYQRRDALPLMQSDQSGRTFFVGSFSKILFRGLRLGYIVAPNALSGELVKSRRALGSSVALPMQPVVAEFMLNGDFARHMNKMRRHYRVKRDYLLQLFEAYLSDWFTWQKPKGGMHAILMLKPLTLKRSGDQLIYKDQFLTDLLKAQQITLSPLSGFYANDTAKELVKEGFVCGFTGISEKQMTRMVVAIREAAQSCFNTLSNTGT